MPSSIATPPGRDTCPSQGYPQALSLCHQYSFIHMGEERDKVFQWGFLGVNWD